MKISNLKFPILLVAVIIILDLLIGSFLERLYFSESSKNNDPLIYSLTKSNDDLIIFGSSRAKHHYNAQMMEKALGTSCYNFGSGGQNIYFHEILLCNLLEFHTPKIIILELMNIDFEITPRQWNKEKLDVLLPFNSKSNIVNEELGKLDSYHTTKTFSNIYPLNSQLYTIIRNNYLPYNNHLNGYIPSEGDYWKEDIEIVDSDYSYLSYDLDKIGAIDRFIETCFLNNIQVFVFISPSYFKYIDMTPYTKMLNRIKQKYQIQVFDFLNHPEFISDNNYFKDPLHLNLLGSTKYTQLVIDSLKKNN